MGNTEWLPLLRQQGESSGNYTWITPGRSIVFVEPDLPVITQADMGKKWLVLCRDEVYVRERVAVEKLIALVVHNEDAESVPSESLPELQRLEIPLYLCDGTVVWSTADDVA